MGDETVSKKTVKNSGLNAETLALVSAIIKYIDEADAQEKKR